VGEKQFHRNDGGATDSGAVVAARGAKEGGKSLSARLRVPPLSSETRGGRGGRGALVKGGRSVSLDSCRPAAPCRRIPVAAHVGDRPRHRTAAHSLRAARSIDINAVFSIIHAQAGAASSTCDPVRPGKGLLRRRRDLSLQGRKLEGREAVRRLLAQTARPLRSHKAFPFVQEDIDVPFSLVLMDLGEKSFLETPSGRAGGASSAVPGKSR